jgi:hypothetical protein
MDTNRETHARNQVSEKPMGMGSVSKETSEDTEKVPLLTQAQGHAIARPT